ncbi:AAA family ATPase [Haloferax sp. Atlit-12N]|uniref:ATP-dependent nuclease n=1 Tax=Haloferax sp. Atlit-12N TaxID=2077203 RepID=UPI003183818D
MTLSMLYRSDESYSKFREIFKDVFGVSPVIDYSDQGSIRIQVGQCDESPPSHPRELGEFIEENGFSPIDEAGDGYLSFAGVVGSLLVSKSRLLLLDEPAAFLHPSQARRLGEWIAEVGCETTEQIVMSTHNANFLNGVLESPTNVSIHRLNRTGDHTQFNQIGLDAAERIATDPLLRSQRVLESAFHTGIVVCEGGSDRAVYEAVARIKHDESDIQFVDGLGLSSLDKIARAATDAQIPVAAIVDLDILNPHRDLTDLIRGMLGGAEYNEVQPIITDYAQIQDEISTLKDGVENMPEKHKEIIKNVIEDASEHGVYLVPCGELEDWMDLDVSPDKKGRWLNEALNTISEGNCPEDLSEFVLDVLNDVDAQYKTRD